MVPAHENGEDRKKAIKRLELLAEKTLRLKQENELRSPILIEFCGSPKAGKTTAITALNIFLKRNGFTTKVLTERASVCPIPSKTHPFFNVWTSCSAIAEITEHLSTGHDKVDVIIADRAIFDALCWFEWLNVNPSKNTAYLGDSEYGVLQQFLTMKFWRQSFSLIYVFTVSPTVSLEREYAALLTDRTGSIMNKHVLAGYNESIASVKTKFSGSFRRIEEIDTTKMKTDPVNFEVTSTVLRVMSDFLEEKVGYITEDTNQKLVHGINPFKKISGYQLQFEKRSVVEAADWIQPIPIAVFTNPEHTKVLVLKKNKRRTLKSSPESGRTLVYAGGHIRFEDSHKSPSFLETIRNALNRELQEELGESINFLREEPFVIYTPISAKSRRHLAVCFVVEVDLVSKSFNPSSKEFITKSGTTISGRILPANKVVHKGSIVESWSSAILKYVCGVTIPADAEQAELDF